MMPFCISWNISKISKAILKQITWLFGGDAGGQQPFGCYLWHVGGSVRLRTHVGDEPDSFVRVYVDDCLQHLGAIKLVMMIVIIYIYIYIWMFPKIGVYTPKWMVKIMENPIRRDDLEGPLFFGNTHIYIYFFWIDQMFSLFYDEWYVNVNSDR